MSLKRSLKRKKMLENRKKAKKAIRSMIDMTKNIPPECSFCGKPFSAEKEDVDKWMLSLNPPSITLQCPECSESDT